jgi:hypothetical protein
MNENTSVFPLRQPGNIDDLLADILRSGARRLLAQAIELEAETFLETMKDLTACGNTCLRDKNRRPKFAESKLMVETC